MQLGLLRVILKVQLMDDKLVLLMHSLAGDSAAAFLLFSRIDRMLLVKQAEFRRGNHTLGIRLILFLRGKSTGIHLGAIGPNVTDGFIIFATAHISGEPGRNPRRPLP